MNAGEPTIAGRAGAAAADARRSVSITNPFSSELVWVPGGRFLMGDTQGIGQSDERPVREVKVAGFWMMRTEVTRAMFAAWVTILQAFVRTATRRIRGRSNTTPDLR